MPGATRWRAPARVSRPAARRSRRCWISPGSAEWANCCRAAIGPVQKSYSGSVMITSAAPNSGSPPMWS